MGSFLFYLIAGGVAFLLVVAFLFFKFYYNKVEQGTALIINGMNKISVRFDGGIVLPIVHKKN